MKSARLVFVCVAAAVCGAAILATPAVATWSLVWSDEFNGTSLDTGNWTPDIGTGCPDLCGWGNNELQYYRAQNLAVTGGNLIITARAENYGGAAFTSGKIHTRGKRAFRYGRFEMRAKLPTGDGMWPAFWMMPQDDVYGGWAASGEIDIMESANATTTVGGALHFGGGWPDNVSTSGSYGLGGTSFADDFHVYAVEWEPDMIRWYVDGVLFMTRTSAQWYTNAAPGNPLAPFDQDFYLILNTAVGGFYTGCISADCVTANLPQQYVIDYIRVYEDIANLAPTVEITAPGPYVPAGDIVLTAVAADPDGSVVGVEFYDGATLIGIDTSPPFSVTWGGVVDGCYTVLARALDDLGGTGTDLLDLTVGEGCGQAAYSGTPWTVPGRIQAEDYDSGGETIAYRDADPANNGGRYRPTEGVDLETCYDAGGGYNTGWTNPDEWLEYTIDVPLTGNYVVDVRVSSLMTGGTFRLAFDGIDKAGDVAIAATGGWQIWTTVSVPVTLTAGTQIMRFSTASSGFNVNWFELRQDFVADVPEPQEAGFVLHPCFPNPFNPSTTVRYDLPRPATVTVTVHDMAGRLVRTLARDESFGAGPHALTWNGRDAAGRVVAAGVYFCRFAAGGTVQTQRMALVK